MAKTQHDSILQYHRSSWPDGAAGTTVGSRARRSLFRCARLNVLTVTAVTLSVSAVLTTMVIHNATRSFCTLLAYTITPTPAGTNTSERHFRNAIEGCSMDSFNEFDNLNARSKSSIPITGPGTDIFRMKETNSPRHWNRSRVASVLSINFLQR
jgi:hypothetical protein